MTTTEKTIYINLFEEINPQRVFSFINFCTQIIQQHRPDILQINIASPGGNVAVGVILHNYLKSLPCKLIMHNIGSVDSIATIVFLAGQERYANANSSFLFHGIVTNFPAQTSMTMFQLKERLGSLEVDQNKISNTITELTRISKLELDNLFLQGEVKSPEFAVEEGFIHEIRELRLPKDAIVFSFA
jgi:ATP-dependent Clp protease, protease subunit